MKKILILGASGFIGRNITKYLVKRGDCHITAADINNCKTLEELNISKNFKLIISDFTKIESFNLLDNHYDEVYHLAAQSYVAYSFEDEFSTFNSNINGTHYMLSAVKEFSNKTKFYFAGSSEMFGKVKESPQNENTIFYPIVYQKIIQM